MGKVYVFLADGFEEIEGLTVVDLLRRASIETVMVSINDTVDVEGSHQIKVKADVVFDDCDYQEDDMLVLPGGMPGTTNLLNHNKLVNLVKRYVDEHRYVAAICAAPSILGLNDLLRDKRVTSYPSHKEKLLGAIYTGNNVEVDGNIITSKGMGTSIDFGLSIITLLKGEKLALEIKESIQYV